MNNKVWEYYKKNPYWSNFDHFENEITYAKYHPKNWITSIENGFNIIGLNISDNKKFRLDNNMNGSSYSFSNDNKKFTAIFSGTILSDFLGKN